jgi:endonuclease/exonuclease/phosphatase family metal-dependent hydrolase
MRILSWNLLKTAGASATDIGRLVERHRPDLVLLQEATELIDALPGLIGGHYVRRTMDRRNHGPAAWSSQPFATATEALPPATRLDLPVPVFRAVSARIALVIRLGSLEVANVHLDHGQWTNRRQLRHLLDRYKQLDIVIGDYNLGTIALPGFADVGPRRTTHRAYGVVPLRLDRCLVRGLSCTAATALDYGNSDHRPILIELEWDRGVAGQRPAELGMQHHETEPRCQSPR